MSDDPWERFRHMTLDQLVTETKLGGSASASYGRTTPEGYPFVVICAVASPGNEMAMVYAGKYFAEMMARASVDRTDNPDMPRCEGVLGYSTEDEVRSADGVCHDCRSPIGQPHEPDCTRERP